MPAAGVNPDFLAGFDLWNGKERVGHWQAVLQARVWRTMPVAHSPLLRGQLLRDADLVMERRDVLALRDVVLRVSKDDNSLALVENVAAGPARAQSRRPPASPAQARPARGRRLCTGQFDHFTQSGNPRRRFARANHPRAQSQNQT